MSDQKNDRASERTTDLDLRDAAPDEIDVEIVSFGDDSGVFPAPEPDPAPRPAASGGSKAERAIEAKLGDAEERYLRLRAEFENFKKRLEREREERERRALAGAFLDLLPVVDNLERAAHAKGSTDDLRKGVELVARQLVDILRRYGLAEIPAVGQPFDPRLHEAVAREESPAHEVATVIGEFQRGYWLNERLLRPAMVKVAVPHESHAGEGSGEANEAADRAPVAGSAPDDGEEPGSEES